MSPLTLYGHIYSTCTQRVVLVLEELGLTYDFQVVDMMQGAHKASDYIEGHHPFGKLPAFCDGDVNLFESRAICRYLVATYGKHKSIALPTGPAAIAAFEQLASVEYCYFGNQISDLAYQNLFKGMMGHGGPDTELVGALTTQLETAVGYFEKLLNQGNFFGGKDPNLVDFFMLPWAVMFPRVRFDSSAYPKFNEWSSRMQSRESWSAIAKAMKH